MSTAMIAITTSNSISVKARRRGLRIMVRTSNGTMDNKQDACTRCTGLHARTERVQNGCPDSMDDISRNGTSRTPRKERWLVAQATDRHERADPSVRRVTDSSMLPRLSERVFVASCAEAAVGRERLQTTARTLTAHYL